MPGQDRNLSRKAPMADDLLLRWEGDQAYQPQFQHPVARAPRPYADPNYEAQVTPPAQQIGLNLLDQGQAQAQANSQDVDDLMPEEKETFEAVLSQIPEQELDTFVERLNKYRRLRAMQAQAQQQQI